MSEADIHFEFYRHLQNAIDDQPVRDGLTLGDVRPEYGENIDGFADIVLFDESGDAVVVIEAKAPKGNSRSRREIDPYSPEVIRQAFRYAGGLGAPYFCTFNGDRLVVFQAYDEGVPLLERSTKSYEISDIPTFADTFLDELARIRAGEAQWDADDDAFIKRVQALHEQITPEMEESLEAHLEEEDGFVEEFHEWTAAQGIEYEAADQNEQATVREEFAEQAAYLLINKIIFYKLLENSPTYADEVESLSVSPFRVQEDLQEYFQHLVDEVDFEAIFAHDDVYSEIPLDPVADKVRDFVIELDDQDLTQFDSDVIGRIYEGVIPAERRKDMGEYYTPPAICDLITHLTIREGNDKVLDPACGSGGFLVSSYGRKRDLLPEERGSHNQLLSQLYGVDINRFPAHLSAINLAIQDLSSHTDRVHIEVNDFFDISPDTMRFGREEAGAGGSTQKRGVIDEIGGFDAVVGNPPYIRYQNLGDREAIRDHLTAVDAEYLSGMSDIYAYFITHGTQFLRDGGRLGVIISDRWLDTKYGADLQNFLLDNYKINAIIQFNRQAFEDALVGSSVLIIEKESDQQARAQNIAKFIEVKERIDIEQIASLVESDIESDKMIVDEDFRLVANTQRSLRDLNKWSVLFMAPPIYFEIIGQDDIVELQDVADLHTGIKTGANDFFYNRREEIEELGLNEYTEPLLKASGQVSKIRFGEEDSDEWGILDIHHLISKSLEENQTFGDDKTEHVKEWLEGNGHKSLAEYIEWGEDNGYHEYTKCKARNIWFDLDELDRYRPQLLIPDFVWTESRVVWNEADAVADWQFHNILPNGDVNPRLLCGILNSRVAWLARELEGRHAGGQGMTRSRMVLYEAEQLSILDPRSLSKEQQERIIDALEVLIEREDELDEDAPLDAKEAERDRLDEAVLAPIGMDDRVDDLKQAVQRMLAIRREGAGEDTEVLVNRPSEREVIELEGVTEARESTTLDDYM